MTIVTTAYPVAPSVTARQKIERAIVSRAVTALLAAGYWLAVCQGDEDEQPASRYKREIMKLLGECDNDRIIVYSPAKGRLGWVLLVYGNDQGETVITDYTVNLEPQLEPVNAYAETLV
jgi:hypothetical protein